VGPRGVLDAVVKRKIPSHRRESNLRTPIVQPVAQRYTPWYRISVKRLADDGEINTFKETPSSQEVSHWILF
jgi:hypothetical protein